MSIIWNTAKSLPKPIDTSIGLGRSCQKHSQGAQYDNQTVTTGIATIQPGDEYTS